MDQKQISTYELYETTSPSVPILASLDAARRDHAVNGEAMWRATISRAEHVAWLTANRELGMFLLDPIDPTERTIRCTATEASSLI